MHATILKDATTVSNSLDFSKLQGKSILITGASGLIGVNLVSCLKLIKTKFDIKIYCWFREKIQEEFQSIFEDCENIIGDITNIEIFSKLEKFDYIIHAAGYAQPSKFLEDKIKTIELNTTSTINLFKLLKESGTMVFISSSEIYSGIDHPEIKETEIGMTNTDHPRSCYIEGKRSGESICHAHAQKGINVKIIRLSSAYGPGTKKNDKRVLNSLIEKGLKDNEINLMDDGSARRVFCYITDVTEMIFNIALHSQKIVYNVGGIYETSILELAKGIGNKLGKNVNVPKDNMNALAGNPKIVNISIEKYLNEFNKKNPFVGFDEGLSNTIEWQKSQLKGNL
jgi:nucleoside-diphosphate-sugar epimerase